MNSIVLDAGVKELLLDDATDFLNSKQWYADRGAYRDLSVLERHANFVCVPQVSPSVAGIFWSVSALL